jgi:methionyl-tRNA formyltransferase
MSSNGHLIITILTDMSSWMNEYNNKLADTLKSLGHEVSIIHSKKEMEKGDIVFFLSCFEIIPTEYLRLNKSNIIVHESNLPQGKGWSPMTWQILEGEKDIPVTLFEADEKVDSGNIYFQDIIHLDGSELINEWQKILGEKTCEMCIKYINYYLSKKWPNSRKQEGDSSFYKRRMPNDSKLDPAKSILDQFNLLRVVDNEKYPAFFIVNENKYIIKIYKV